MQIEFSCPRCGTHFSVSANSAGKKGQCKKCRHMMTVPPQRKQAAPVVTSGLYRIDGATLAALKGASTATIAGLQRISMSIPTQVALAPISEDLVNPMIRDAPDLNDEDSGKYYSLAATDPRLRPLGRRKRRSSNLPDWMNEEPFLRIRRFVENLGPLPGV
mgnify:CR=1 FL=1